MKTPLQDLLMNLLEVNDSKNPALKFLLNDYAKYHLVLVVLGGLSFVALTLFSGYQFHQIRKNGNIEGRLTTIGGKAHFYLGLFSGSIALGLGLIVIGNLGNAINPKSGFRNSLEMLSTPTAGSKSALLQQSFTEWIRSGRKSAPLYVDQIVNERLSWQVPKAILSLLLLILFIYFSNRVWSSIIDGPVTGKKFRKSFKFSTGVITTLLSTLFLVMAIANSQGSIAPVALSLFFS